MADPSITRSTRTYILATLFSTLAATALIAMFLVILCPAQVNFMVTDAWRNNSSDNNTVSLHLSILTNTSQRRTMVRFESIFIDILNYSSDPHGSEDDWRLRINAHVDDMPSDYLKYPVNRSMSVSAATPTHSFLEFAPDWIFDDYGSGLIVKVMAQVHFKVGVLCTRLYAITVFCDGVIFPNQNDNASGYVRQDGKKFPFTCHN